MSARTQEITEVDGRTIRRTFWNGALILIEVKVASEWKTPLELLESRWIVSVGERQET